MKIILSRKGFDSGAGGVASPILPDGRLLSFPIPQANGPCRVADVRIPGGLPGAPKATLAALVEPLTRGRVHGRQRIHLDPDLVADMRPRPSGWRPIFGQAGAAQSHLAAEGVAAGDLFLFFGWFRAIEAHDCGWRYCRSAPDMNAVFGWMQIGAVHAVDNELRGKLSWAREHPHLVPRDDRLNTVYVAADHLTLPDGTKTALPGAGTFGRYADALRLTEAGASRTRWRLPGWFLSRSGPTLSYHRDPMRWTRAGRDVLLQSVARGQEFVLPVADARESATDWIGRLFAAAKYSV